jgi:hypothetical protein
MAKKNAKPNCENSQAPRIEVSDRQIEIFARRLLPEIKRFFTDESIRQEFEEWQGKRQENLPK